ncbi:hypothetical protein [Comamonas sp. NoAH]|uniref:hypothetical protein n=1 Tax=Comamonas halotolerans TaxID=3041496 RepID=UPI0024E061D4|nr:hypothetical protein [Comamonas sp. NoAH]
MARIRTVKPELFKHEDLFELEEQTGLPIRIAFVGLFTCCDREGRFKWRPRALKLDVLPYDMVDFSRVLDALITRGFVVKYAINGEVFGEIPSFKRHQTINNKEVASEIPAPPENLNKSSTCTGDSRDVHANGTREPREGHATQGEGKGKEGKEDSAELDASNSTPASPIELDLVGGSQGQIEALVNIPLNDGTEYPVTQGMVDEWALTYPAIDVLQKLREIRAWCLANKANRKTSRGVDAFIVRWLSKEQDRAPRAGGYVGQQQPAGSGVGSFV